MSTDTDSCISQSVPFLGTVINNVAYDQYYTAETEMCVVLTTFLTPADPFLPKELGQSHSTTLTMLRDTLLTAMYNSGRTQRADYGDSNRHKPSVIYRFTKKLKAKDVPLHATKSLEGRGGIAPTHSRPRH
jgi:hypothetical protein